MSIEHNRNKYCCIFSRFLYIFSHNKTFSEKPRWMAKKFPMLGECIIFLADFLFCCKYVRIKTGRNNRVTTHIMGPQGDYYRWQLTHQLSAKATQLNAVISLLKSPVSAHVAIIQGR